MKGNLQVLGSDGMLIIPSDLLETAELKPGMQVNLTAESGGIFIHSRGTRRYTLAELIQECDRAKPEENRDWLDAPAVGDELI